MPKISDRLAFISQLISDQTLALSSESQQLTYQQLIAEVRQCSEWLKELGAKVVALHAENSIDWVITDLACQELGLSCIPLPAFFSSDQIKQCIIKSGVDTVLSDQLSFHQLLVFDEIKPIEKESYSSLHAWQISTTGVGEFPEETQKITFTSGSTGSPKGVCLSANHQWQVAQSLADIIDIKQPKHLCLLPLSTLLENFAGIYSTLLCGGTVIIPSDQNRGMKGSSKLDSKALLTCIAKHEPTTMILIPQLLTLLVAACQAGWQPPSSLQFVAVGGGKVSPELIQSAQQYGLPIFQGYGLSECGSVVALNARKDNQLDAVGHVLPHCSVSIENSEVVVSGANFLGYLGEPDSWYPDKVYTGDIGKLKDGFLFIDGRKKNILISSFGRNISPEWVESMLMSTPLFNQCMVVGDGMPALSALVSASEKIDDENIDQWIQQVNQTLPDYARINYWSRVNDSALRPYMTANGRLQRDKVEDAFSNVIENMYAKDTVRSTIR
jgi:long-subunit acyl-CoA synthetase (AMP-forming)